MLNLPFLYGSDGYYRKIIDLQEQLRKSEAERLRLEEQFQEILKVSRKEEHERLRKFRQRYQKFLQEDKVRQERNYNILCTLERIESRASALAAKSERFNNVRKRYHDYLRQRHAESEPDHPFPELRQKLFEDDDAVLREVLKKKMEKLPLGASGAVATEQKKTQTDSKDEDSTTSSDGVETIRQCAQKKLENYARIEADIGAVMGQKLAEAPAQKKEFNGLQTYVPLLKFSQEKQPEESVAQPKASYERAPLERKSSMLNLAETFAKPLIHVTGDVAEASKADPGNQSDDSKLSSELKYAPEQKALDTEPNRYEKPAANLPITQNGQIHPEQQHQEYSHSDDPKNQTYYEDQQKEPNIQYETPDYSQQEYSGDSSQQYAGQAYSQEEPSQKYPQQDPDLQYSQNEPSPPFENPNYSQEGLNQQFSDPNYLNQDYSDPAYSQKDTHQPYVDPNYPEQAANQEYIDPTYSQSETSPQYADPNYSQQEPNQKYSDPAYSQNGTNQQYADPNYSQQISKQEYSEPNYSQNDTNQQYADAGYSQPDANQEYSDLKYSQNDPNQPYVDPSYSQQDSNQQYSDPKYSQSDAKQEYADPGYSQQDANQEYADPTYSQQDVNQDYSGPKQQYVDPSYTQQSLNPEYSDTNYSQNDSNQQYAEPSYSQQDLGQQYADANNPSQQYSDPSYSQQDPNQSYDQQYYDQSFAGQYADQQYYEGQEGQGYYDQQYYEGYEGQQEKQASEGKQGEKNRTRLAEMLDTDTESTRQEATKLSSNDSDFDFSTN